MSRVGIIGIGHGVFGRRSDATVQELAFEAFREAVQDAGIERDRIDASVIGSVPEYHKQRSLPGVVQEYLGLNPKPTWLTEVACSSGSAAIRTGWMSIKAGVHDVVAVIGCQKMTELSTPEILALMGRVGEVQWESIFGTTFPAYYALFAQRHMHEYGTSREQLLQVAVKNHYYGARNPKALFQKEITIEKAAASEAMRRVLAGDPCNALMIGKLGRLLHHERDFAALIQVFGQAAKQCPNEPNHQNDYAWALSTVPVDRLRDGAKALGIMRSLLANQPNKNPQPQAGMRVLPPETLANTT